MVVLSYAVNRLTHHFSLLNVKVALSMKSEGAVHILINVYMPCENDNSTEDFISQLAYLCVIWIGFLTVV